MKTIEEERSSNSQLSEKLNAITQLHDEIVQQKAQANAHSMHKIASWYYNRDQNRFTPSPTFNEIFCQKCTSLIDFFDFLDTDSVGKISKLLAQNKFFETSFNATINDYHRTFYIKVEPINGSEVIAVVEDMTELLQEQERLMVLNRAMHAYIGIIDNNIATVSADERGHFVDVSEAYEILSGRSKEESIGKNINIMRHPDTDKAFYRHMWDTLKSGKMWSGEIQNINKNGESFWVKAVITPKYYDKTIAYTAIYNDISATKKLQELSTIDDLTGLGNRRYFNEMISKEMKRLRRSEESIIFMMLDIDHFKRYNDTYGHAKGDEVLSRVGKTLLASLGRGRDYAFRLGGEEFGILTSGISLEESIAFANKICKNIEALHILHKNSSVSPYLTVSVGVVHSNLMVDLIDEHGLYTVADDALYAAKNSGRNRIAIHEENELELF
jgi:diguanylate cyclase (GGDEF)-like protein/PAS domain S-box-containing protein